MDKKQKKVIKNTVDEHELAVNYVFPVKLSRTEKQVADNDLMDVLSRRRNAKTSEDKLKAILLQFRFEIEQYLTSHDFDEKKTFGHFLKQYIQGLNKKQVDFAYEIDVKPAELSQYINNHRTPPQNIIIRLELHSRNVIPAAAWYQLVEKEKLHDLNTNSGLRTREKRFVKRTAELV
jgi:plasmid maintenance system antidote protein VapI